MSTRNGHVPNASETTETEFSDMTSTAHPLPSPKQTKGKASTAKAAPKPKSTQRITIPPPPPGRPAYKVPMVMPPNCKRLPSLQPPRDLTLGGLTGPPGTATSAAPIPKKVFKPNLNVVRNKNTNVKTSKDTSGTGSRGRGRGGSAAGRGAGGRGGRNGPKASLIQTTGVFSEGAGLLRARRAGSSYGGRSEDASGTSPQMCKPTVTKIDIKTTQTRDYEDLLGDEKVTPIGLGGDGFGDDDYEEKTDVNYLPVMLDQIKSVIRIKQENGEVEQLKELNEAILSQHLRKIKIETTEREAETTTLDPSHDYPRSLEELFHTTKHKIIMIQLPDSLPHDAMEDVKAPYSKLHTDMETVTADPRSETPVGVSSRPAELPPSSILKGLPDGQVGKLIRYKSGKIKMVLGNTPFHLDLGVESGMLENIVSITTNPTERNGNIVNLGRLQGKIVASPDWDSLLTKLTRSHGHEHLS